MTLLQAIKKFIDNISVTDRQEENIQGSLSNLELNLCCDDNGLSVIKLFTNGSYERDTIIRPLDDIDVFAVLDRDKWNNNYGSLPDPQSVLSKFKNYLNNISDYEGKVKQDRPCVTIQLSDKGFDVLPSFAEPGGGYSIPNFDLKSWTFSFPEQLSGNIDHINKQRNYVPKDAVKAIKYWNRDSGKLIPSYHIEETAFNIFSLYNFANLEEAIRLWFENAEYQLLSLKFQSNDNYIVAVRRVRKVKDKLKEAKDLSNTNEEEKTIAIWKEVFGKDFPVADVAEAKEFSKALSRGNLKILSSGTLSLAHGNSISSSKGFDGDVPDR